VPAWSSSRFRQKTYHQFAPDPPFTRASWRGRINASKGIGAGLPAEQARAFDRERKALLEHVAPPRCSVRHRITIHIFEPR
jgi:hypothetical protein